jgi:hypothetical protein
MKPTVELVIATCDRLLYLDQAIHTARLTASFCSNADVSIIISDNSRSDATFAFCKVFHPDLRLVSRRLTALEHFDAIIKDCSSDFLVIMHDDDRLLASYLPALVTEMIENPALIAVACNALVCDEALSVLHDNCMHSNFNLEINSPAALLDRYYGQPNHRIAPFPSYCYRHKKMRHLSLSGFPMGKYSDVAFLCSVAESGPILWLSKPHYVYRVHSSNDTNSYDRKARSALLDYLCSRYFQNRQARELHSLKQELALPRFFHAKYTLSALKRALKLNPLLKLLLSKINS